MDVSVKMQTRRGTDWENMVLSSNSAFLLDLSFMFIKNI